MSFARAKCRFYPRWMEPLSVAIGRTPDADRARNFRTAQRHWSWRRKTCMSCDHIVECTTLGLQQSYAADIMYGGLTPEEIKAIRSSRASSVALGPTRRAKAA